MFARRTIGWISLRLEEPFIGAEGTNQGHDHEISLSFLGILLLQEAIVGLARHVVLSEFRAQPHHVRPQAKRLIEIRTEGGKIEVSVMAHHKRLRSHEKRQK